MYIQADRFTRAPRLCQSGSALQTLLVLIIALLYKLCAVLKIPDSGLEAWLSHLHQVYPCGANRKQIKVGLGRTRVCALRLVWDREGWRTVHDDLVAYVLMMRHAN